MTPRERVESIRSGTTCWPMLVSLYEVRALCEIADAALDSPHNHGQNDPPCRMCRALAALDPPDPRGQ